MTQERNTTSSIERNGAMPVPRSQLALPGAGGADAFVWGARIGAGVLVLAMGWLAFSAIRPLPRPDAPTIASIPSLHMQQRDALSLDERERLLAEAIGENIFNPERLPWTPAVNDNELAAEDGTNPDGATNAATGAEAQSTDPAIADAISGEAPREITYDDIEVASRSEIPPAVMKSLRELELRGIYGRDGGYIAQIGLISNKRRMKAESYAVGDTFDDDHWKVLAINPNDDRVILRRADKLNVELTLYEPGETVQPLPEPEDSRSAAEAMATITQRTPDEVRTDLAEGGVESSEIEELLRLADASEDELEEEPEAPPEEGKVADAQEKKPETAAPAGLGSILRMMARDPFGRDEADTSESAQAGGDSDDDKDE